MLMLMVVLVEVVVVAERKMENGQLAIDENLREKAREEETYNEKEGEREE
jgi:hypothetical protein